MLGQPERDGDEPHPSATARPPLVLSRGGDGVTMVLATPATPTTTSPSTRLGRRIAGAGGAGHVERRRPPAELDDSRRRLALLAPEAEEVARPRRPRREATPWSAWRRTADPADPAEPPPAGRRDTGAAEGGQDAWS